jgi:hypothetical protein
LSVEHNPEPPLSRSSFRILPRFVSALSIICNPSSNHCNTKRRFRKICPGVTNKKLSQGCFTRHGQLVLSIPRRFDEVNKYCTAST